MLGSALERLRSGDRRLVWGLIAAATLVRLAYGVLVNSPLSGPDAELYATTGRALAERGLFTDLCDIVERRAGYVVFIGGVYEIIGDQPRGFIVLQVLLCGLAAFSAYSLARRELGPDAGLLALVLQLASPAALASSTELMYEPLLGAGLVVGADCVSRAMAPTTRHRRWLALAGGVTLGLASTLHPKAILVALALLAFLLLRRRPAAGLALACVAGMLVGPAAVATRTAIATGEVRIASQLGVSIYGIGNSQSNEERARTPGPNGPCISRFEAAVPRQTASVAPTPALVASLPLAQKQLNLDTLLQRQPAQLRNFWGPMVLPAQLGHGTWFHAFTPARLAPDSVARQAWFGSAISGVELAWSAGSAALVLLGTVLVVFDRRRRRSRAFLLLAPLGLVLLLSLVTLAEARFRLPVASFYVPLQALALLWLFGRFAAVGSGTRSFRDGAPGAGR